MDANLHIDVTPKKKKKKSKSTALAVTEKLPSKAISKTKLKGLKSILGDNVEVIHKLLERNETDSAVALLNKAALQSTIDLIPFAESAVRKSKGQRNVYQFNTLINTMQQLLADLQNSQDRGLLGQALINTIVKPCFANMAQDIVTAYADILGDAKDSLNSEDYLLFKKRLLENRSALAGKINTTFREIEQQTIAYLQR